MLHADCVVAGTGFQPCRDLAAAYGGPDGQFAACGQEDSEARHASIGVSQAAERDAPFVLLDDAFADPEPKASAFCALCAEEWFEKPF